MAEITATIRDNQGNAKVGWTVQFRLASTNAVVSTTADGTVTDYGNGTYVTNNAPTCGTYDVYACAAGGTPALVKGYDNIRHLVFPLPEQFGGTGFTSLQNLPAEIGLEIGTDVQAWDSTLDQLIGVGSGLGVSGFVINDDGTGITGATPAEARTLIGLTDSDGSRELLGVEIGADVQAYSSKLTTLAANIADTAEDPAFLVVNGAGVTPEIVSASSARTHLGLGTSAVIDKTVTGEYNKMLQIGSKGTVTLPADDGSVTNTAPFLNHLFVRQTGNTTLGTYGIYACVISGVSGGNYTYALTPIYESSWGGA